MNNIDIVIIGAGPIGIACALEFKKRGFSYIVIDKGTLTNSLYHYPKNMTFFSTAEKLEIAEIPFISNHPKPNRDEALEYYRRVATSNKLAINLYENVRSVQKTEDTFQVKTDKQTYECKKVILATGFYDLPNKLNVPGETLPKVLHYYNEAHPYAMQNVIVVGASNSSVDAALEVWRKGGEVTMVIRGEAIGDRVKYWVRPDIINRIKEKSITAYFNSEIKSMTLSEVVITTPEGEKTIPNDFVLALTGYHPNFEILEKAGVILSDDAICKPQYNEKTMETNVKGLYLAGVICGGMETHKWFIENSIVHAKMIAEHLEDQLKIQN